MATKRSNFTASAAIEVNIWDRQPTDSCNWGSTAATAARSHIQQYRQYHRKMLTNNDYDWLCVWPLNGYYSTSTRWTYETCRTSQWHSPKNHTNRLPKSIYNSLVQISKFHRPNKVHTGQLFSFWYPWQDCNWSCAFKCEFILGKDVHRVEAKLSEERFLQVLCRKKTVTAFKCGKLFTNYKLLPSVGRTKFGFEWTYVSAYNRVILYSSSMWPCITIASLPGLQLQLTLWKPW